MRKTSDVQHKSSCLRLESTELSTGRNKRCRLAKHRGGSFSETLVCFVCAIYIGAVSRAEICLMLKRCESMLKQICVSEFIRNVCKGRMCNYSEDGCASNIFSSSEFLPNVCLSEYFCAKRCELCTWIRNLQIADCIANPEYQIVRGFYYNFRKGVCGKLLSETRPFSKMRKHKRNNF